MATVKIFFKNGNYKTWENAGTSIYNNFLYIWAMGKRKGNKPLAKIPLSEINTKKSTGKKGIFISKGSYSSSDSSSGYGY